MQKIRYFSWLACIIILLFTACKKDDPQDVDKPLVFDSLISEYDTIPFMGSTKITATADGDGIVYIWTFADGAIDGSGAVVTYNASPCVAGDIQVSCTVKDKGNNKLTKSVSIFVQL